MGLAWLTELECLKEKKNKSFVLELKIETVPALDGMRCPSSSNEKEHTNSELVCDILAPSPEIFTFTVVSSSDD